MQAVSRKLVAECKSLWVFPEGTRSYGQGLGTFKKAAFHVALAAGYPITMVCVGEYDSRPRGLWGRRAPVTVRVLPPVETQDLPQLMERCRRQMADTIAAISRTQAAP